MAEITLAPELLSLVQHVELNKAGWWQKSLERLILAAIWLADEPPIEDNLAEILHTTFHIKPDPKHVKEQVDSLRSQGTVTLMAGGTLRLAPTALATFEQELREAEEVESYAKQRFATLLKLYCPSVDSEVTWSRFDQDLLVPLVRETGANTYRLLTGGRFRMDPVRIGEFLRAYSPELHVSLQKAIRDFLDPSDTRVCSYVFRLLHAHLCVEAGNLRDETLAVLEKLSESPPSYSVFVDTNFLFSLLSLHDNPSNQAATLLRGLIAQLAERVPIKLHMLPCTVSEARNALIAAKLNIDTIPLEQNVTNVARSAGLSGIAQKYFEERSKRGVLVTAEDFFSPYIKDLIAVARSQGIELYNENADGYKTRQDVADDILAQTEFEERRVGRGLKGKGYDQIEHDMVLWHIVRDRRHADLESPLEARYWIVTVDYRLLAFDAYKRREEGTAVPLCLHPSNFVSMLQFWVPRSSAFEEAVLGTMRLPFLFQEFDAEAEKITLRILQAIGRFEGIGDLSEEVIAGVVGGDAIRARIESASDEQSEVELIRDALIQELKKDVQEKAEGIKELQETAADKDRTIGELQKSKANMEQSIAALEGTVETDKRTLTGVQQELERQAQVISRLEASVEAKESEAETQKAIRRFVARWSTITVVVLGLLAPALSLLIVKAFKLSSVWTAIAVYLVSALVLVVAADKAAASDAVVRDWAPLKYFHRFRGWLLGVIVVGLALELVGNYVWDSITGAPSPSPGPNEAGGARSDHERPLAGEEDRE